MNVLCIGAHCDDVEVGCGGTILCHVARHDFVTYFVMSSSDRRRREVKKASAMLGVTVEFGPFEDTNVPSGKEAVKLIDESVRLFSVDRIYTHTPRDAHQDHRNTALASLSAGRRVPQILFYESAPPKSWCFTPNFYVDISNYLAKKLEVVKVFQSQAEKWYMQPNVLEAMATFRGVEIARKACEAFEVYKYLEEMV